MISNFSFSFIPFPWYLRQVCLSSSTMQLCASLTFATKSINIIEYCPSAMFTIFSSTFFHFEGEAKDETKKDQSFTVTSL